MPAVYLDYVMSVASSSVGSAIIVQDVTFASASTVEYC